MHITRARGVNVAPCAGKGCVMTVISPPILNRARFKLTLKAFEWSDGENGKGPLVWGMRGDYTTGHVFCRHWFISAGLCDSHSVAKVQVKMEFDQTATDISDGNLDSVISGVRHTPENRIYAKTEFEYPLEPSGIIVNAWENVADDQDIIPINKSIMRCLSTVKALWRMPGDRGILYILDDENRPVFGIMPVWMGKEDEGD